MNVLRRFLCLRIYADLQLHCLAVAVVLMLILPFLTGFDVTRHITVVVDGQRKNCALTLVTPARFYWKQVLY